LCVRDFSIRPGRIEVKRTTHSAAPARLLGNRDGRRSLAEKPYNGGKIGVCPTTWVVQAL
jgi:hypothetical protein